MEKKTMATTFELDGDSVVFRVTIPTDLEAFNRGKSEGREIPIRMVERSADREKLEAAKNARAEWDQVESVIDQLESELASLRPGEGIDGLVRHRRAKAEKREEIEAAKEVRDALRKKVEAATNELAASIGGTPGQLVLPCPESVQSALDSIERIARESARELIHHAGALDGFIGAKRFLTARAAADSIAVMQTSGQPV